MLDTNTCSFIIRNRPPSLVNAMAHRVREGHLFLISAITYTELRFGAIGKKASPKHEVQVDQFVQRIDEILPFDRKAVEAATKVKDHLSKLGQNIGPNDTLIAGHALSVKATLITHNLREFDRVPGLITEDWVK